MKGALLASALVLATSPARPPVHGEAARPATARPAPAARWTSAALADLLAAVAAAASEGLDPADYGEADLRRLAANGPGADADRVADEAALALARDYAQGRVTDRARFGWFVETPAIGHDALRRDLIQALAQGRLRAWLGSLLPADRRYAALRAALAAAAPDDPRRVAILANMERWRWMPRAPLGERHLWINVPSYRVALVENGGQQDSFVAVVGAPDTPTPALSTAARAAVVNPWWSVPRSIVERGEVRPGASAVRRGFVFAADGRVRQKPGPANALGRIKIELPNPHAIYLHDTPARALFAARDRARSHGCIRVQNIEALAARLAAEPAAVAAALTDQETRTIPLQPDWPVWIVYFTLDAAADGRLISYRDIYRQDAALVAALRGHPPAAKARPASALEPAGPGDADGGRGAETNVSPPVRATTTTAGAEPGNAPADPVSGGAAPQPGAADDDRMEEGSLTIAHSDQPEPGFDP